MLRWDIFCAVIDNYGDAAVSWRLAKQLVHEHEITVRLWIDNLTPLAALVDGLSPTLPRQTVAGVEVCHWAMSAWTQVEMASVVVAAFGCRLPPDYLVRMAQLPTPPRWLNLEYLSAETWVDNYHLMPSPHPQLPLVQDFYFPGFTARTGGLLREADVLRRRDHFRQLPTVQAALWQRLQCPPPALDAIKISLFAYSGAPVTDLLDQLARWHGLVWCAIPSGQLDADIDAWLSSHPCRTIYLQRLPFLTQEDYDLLLWSCDVNCVRGEDSLLRAIWAGRPLIWHIYPQAEQAHHAKLDALLTLVCVHLPTPLANGLRQCWHSWNLSSETPVDIARYFLNNLTPLTVASRAWQEELAQHPDLCTQMVKLAQIR